MIITVDAGETITKDPNAALVYTFDWDERNLAVGAQISTGSVVVTALYPSTTDTALVVVDSGPGLGIISGGRKYAVKLSAGTEGQAYRIASRIVTNETPSQIKNQSVILVIEQG